MTASLLVWLADVTIKGSLLILLVGSIFALTRGRLDPRWRHLLWVVVLVRLLMPDAPASRWSLFNLLSGTELHRPAPALMVQAAGERATLPPVLEEVLFMPFRAVLSASTVRWIVGIWLAVAFALLARTIIASVRTRRAVMESLSRAESQVPLAPDSTVPVIETDLVRTPALHGLFRPVILLPRGLPATFSPEELRHIVLHEQWHHRRLDVAVSWVLAAVQALHWFNPLVWFAAARIREERELACDELALSCLEEEERSGYGMTILKLLERFRAPAPVPALVGIVNNNRRMKRRITMIASFRSRARLSTFLVVAVAAIGIAGLTDAGERMHQRIMKEIDPATQATMERFHEPVSLELTNATLSELLGALSTASGVVVTQSPEIADNADAQNARFTVKAEQVPAHLVLMESLMPFKLSPKPDGAGVTVVEGELAMHVMHMDHGASADGEVRKHVIVTNGEKVEADRVIKVLEGDEVPADAHKVVIHKKHVEGDKTEVDEKVFVRKVDPGAYTPDADGHIRRELKLNMDVNGVKTEGKLTLDIATK